MYLTQGQVIRLLIISFIGAVMIMREWHSLHPSLLPMITAEEMARRVPDFQLVLPPLKDNEINRSLARMASRDSRESGFDGSLWHAVFCPKSRCYMYVLTTKHYATDTHMLYRADAENKHLLEKCQWNIYQNWPPTTPADREVLERQMQGREGK